MLLHKLKVNSFVNRVVKSNTGHVWTGTLTKKVLDSEFENALLSVEVVPREDTSCSEAGLNAMENGNISYPLVDIKAKLYDGSYHDVDSSLQSPLLWH